MFFVTHNNVYRLILMKLLLMLLLCESAGRFLQCARRRRTDGFSSQVGASIRTSEKRKSVGVGCGFHGIYFLACNERV